MRQIQGRAAAEFIDERISASRDRFATFLATLEPCSAFYAWFETYRAIEEFINLPLFALEDEALERRILQFRLDSQDLEMPELAAIHKGLSERLDSDIVRRYLLTIAQACGLGIAARIHGLPYANHGFKTIGEAVGYFQSRRRHFLALLYTIPQACRGKRPVDETETLNLFVPMMEIDAIPLTGLHLQRTLVEVFPDYQLFVHDNVGFSSNHEYETLDKLFLEPERLGVDQMYRERYQHEMGRDLEPTDPGKIFSPAELRNNLRLIETGYAEFDLAGTDFGAIARIMPSVLDHCSDGFRIEMTVQQLDQILGSARLPSSTRAMLLHDGADFVHNTNQFAPFIGIEGKCLSSVTLLGRFFNHLKSRCLDGVRRFQIHSGFVLEDMVKTNLSDQGFSITDVKRINRREFDVVALLNGVAYNVQCKNNHLDLTQFERYPERFARHNRRLDRYYSKALRMEEDREHLLKERLKVSQVRHVVVSRFPVATINPRIISFGEVDEFRQRFAT